MWHGYSTRDAAQFVGLPESAVRSCVRAGFVAPGSGGASLRLSFRDLLVLKTVKTLRASGVPLRRIRRQLGELTQNLSQATSLSSLSLSAHAGHVIVRDQNRAWQADSGQLVFDFLLDAAGSETEKRGEMAPIPERAPEPSPAPEEEAPIEALTADEWLERAFLLEEEDPEQAKEAYRRALRFKPDCSEALIDLGRVYAETGEATRAADCFQRALELDPSDATALYNLGVVAQDAGEDSDAIALYRRSLSRDPALAEAHYNLATIYDRTGEAQLAIRHLNEYRKLTRAR